MNLTGVIWTYSYEMTYILQMAGKRTDSHRSPSKPHRETWSEAEAQDAKATRPERSDGSMPHRGCPNGSEDRGGPPTLFNTTKHPVIGWWQGVV